MSGWIDPVRWQTTPLNIVSLGSAGKVLASDKYGTGYATYINYDFPYNNAWHLSPKASLSSETGYYNDNTVRGCLNVYSNGISPKLVWPPKIGECQGGKPTYWVYDSSTRPGGGSLQGTNRQGSGYWLCANQDGLYRKFATGIDPGSTDCKWIDRNTAVQCCTQNTSPAFANTYCSPNYNPTNDLNACPQLMVDVCTGDWDNAVCNNYISSFVNSANARSTVKLALNNYIRTHPNTDYTVSGGKKMADDPFYSSTAPQLCNIVIGACDQILDDFCSIFTRDDCLRDTGIQYLCGCHLPGATGGLVKNNQYPYSDLIEIECDPVCQLSGTAQRGYQNTDGLWHPIQCTEDICILDNIVINQINSQGDVNINQFCGDCAGGGKCVCWMHNVNVNEINSSTKRIQIDQACGNSCFTYSTDSRNYTHEVNCNTGVPPTPSNGGWLQRLRQWISEHYILFGFIVVLIIILISVLVIFLVYEYD